MALPLQSTADGTRNVTRIGNYVRLQLAIFLHGRPLGKIAPYILTRRTARLRTRRRRLTPRSFLWAHEQQSVHRAVKQEALADVIAKEAAACGFPVGKVPEPSALPI